jgi:transposase
MSKYKRIPVEIKNEILSKIKEGRPASDLAHQYGISSKTIYNWVGASVQTGSGQVNMRDHLRVLRENEELKRIIGMLTLTVERGKKD